MAMSSAGNGWEQRYGGKEKLGMGVRHSSVPTETLSNIGHLVLVSRVGTAAYLKQPQPPPCVTHTC